MDYLDLGIIAVLFLNIALGYALGIVRRLVAFVGLFAGIGAETLTSANTSTSVATTFGLQSALWAHVVTYLGIVSGSLILFEVLGSVYQRHLSELIAPMFDRLTGMLSGATLGAFEVTLMLIVGVGLVNAPLPAGFAYPPAFLRAQELFFGSVLAPHFYGLEPLTRFIFGPVLPPDVGGYFSQLLVQRS